MELMPGYKRSDVGVIPEDWEVKPLGEVVDFLDGRRRPVKDSDRAKMRGDIPYYGASGNVDYLYELLFDEDLILLGEDGENILSRNCRLAFKISGKTWVNNHAHVLRPKPGMILDYLVEFLESRDYDHYNTGTAQPKLNKMVCSGIPVPCPPPPEQRAIAQALSDVDALLTKLDQLIAKKRDLKQATMQQLLTGKTRLPGFSGDWEVRKLGEVADIIDPHPSHRAPREVSNGVPFVGIGDLDEEGNIIGSKLRLVDAIVLQEHAQRYDLADGLIGLGRVASIGKVVALKKQANEYVISPTLGVIHGRQVPRDFLLYSLRSQFVTEQFTKIMSGSTRSSVGMEVLRDVRISVPPSSEEQSAIAGVLSSMDAELSALEARRDKTSNIKQAMMQELLTGKKRLITQPQIIDQPKNQQANVYFRRSVWAAEIIDQLHNEPTFGHVKLEKMIFLSEHICNIDLASHYLRKAAGPYDPLALRSIDSQIKKQNWFQGLKENGRYRYVPLQNQGGHKQYFDRYFRHVAPQLNELINIFRTWDTERCEIVATLYSAWQDLLKQGSEVTDKVIVDEVIHHWHESKKRIEPERWYRAIQWMRTHKLLPKGAV